MDNLCNVCNIYKKCKRFVFKGLVVQGKEEQGGGPGQQGGAPGDPPGRNPRGPGCGGGPGAASGRAALCSSVPWPSGIYTLDSLFFALSNLLFSTRFRAILCISLGLFLLK